MKQWDQTFCAKMDKAGVLERYTEDATLYTFDGNSIVSASEIASYFFANYSKIKICFKPLFKELTTGRGYEYGTYEMRVRSNIIRHGKYSIVWFLEKSTWKISNQILG